MTGKTLTLALLLLPLQLFAHGEDRPGPHQGFIRMPGAFHVEVVPSKDSLQIYLLDMNWKNPTIKNSSVSISLSGSTILCVSHKSFFVCPLKKPLPTSGTLAVNATRENQKGNEAIYDLPLRLEVKKASTEDHSHH